VQKLARVLEHSGGRPFEKENNMPTPISPVTLAEVEQFLMDKHLHGERISLADVRTWCPDNNISMTTKILKMAANLDLGWERWEMRLAQVLMA
jgi:hypothetical protein